MRTLFVILALVCCILSGNCDTSGDNDTAVDRGNKYVDDLIDDLLREHTDILDPYRLPDRRIFFHKKIAFVNFTGEAKLHDGFLSGLRTLHRSNNCSLELIDGRVYVHAIIGAFGMNLEYSSSIKFMDKRVYPKVVIHGTSLHVEVHLGFSINATTGLDAVLEDVTIQDIHNIRMWITGLGPLNWYISPLLTKTMRIFKNTLTDLIEEVTRRNLWALLPRYQFPVYGLDFEKEVIPEGKRGYDIEDANVYFDEVLNGRFREEIDYARLDPFIMENTRIDNVYIQGENITELNYADLTNGTMLDLSTAKRLGDCEKPKWRNYNLTFICYLEFDQITVNHDARAVHGEEESNFQLKSVVHNVKIAVQITASSVDNVPNLQRFYVIRPGKMTVTAAVVIVDEYTPYNRTAITDNISSSIEYVLKGRFKDVLSYSVYKTRVNFLET